MANIFISHSSRNSEKAIEVRNWLAKNGWDDVFLDLDPERGIVAGQRWKEALQKAAHRCEVVLALVSPEWLASGWCKSEIDAARLIGKKVIVALIGADKGSVPLDLSDEQWIDLINDPAAYWRLKEGLKRAGLDPSSFPLEPGRRPYPGFAYLEEQDAALFFGRDAQIVRGLDKMRGLARTGVERMLVILGASGSGKSSFLRAGLWPRLKRDDRSWLPLPVIRPERAAISGKFGLAQALLQTMSEEQFAGRVREAGLPRSRADIQDFIEKTDEGLAKLFAALRDIAQVPGLSGETVAPPTIVVAIDQGEELFNEDGREEARRFVAILTRTLKADARVLALVAMRSDGFPLLQAEPSMADLPKDTFTLDMMLEGSYRAVIEGPAQLVQPNPLKIDPQLVDALLEDISGQDALPLLAFTLAHLYEHYAADNELNLSGYEKLGRLKGVIDTTVKDALAEGVAKGELPKDPKAQLALARAAFIPHLAQVNPAGQFLRRVATRDEIPDEAKPLIDCFADRRLLIRDRRKVAGKDAEVIEVAHETLLRQPPFSEWLAEDREFLMWRERLSQARAAFEANERGLLSGRELQLARDWLQRRAERDIAPADRKFINDSVDEDNARRADEAERERKRLEAEREARHARKLRYALLGVGAATLIAIIGWGVAGWQGHMAEKAKEVALLTQMKHLTETSNRETDQGDAATGLLLALEALPDSASEDDAIRKRQSLPAAALSLERANRALLERTVLRGHNGPVIAVAMTRDGNRIVTASDDGTARVWDTETGKELGVLRDAGGKAVTALAVMSDPPRIVTGTEDGTVRVWNAGTFSELTAFESRGGAITALALTSEPLRVIAFSKDKKGHIWNVLTRFGRTFDSPDAVNAVAMTSDAFITASDDKIARVWDIETQQERTKLTGHDGPVTAVAVTREGDLIVTGSTDKTIRIWNADTGRQRGGDMTGHLDAITDLAITADGARIISGSNDKTVRIWDAETGKQLAQIGGHQMSIDAVAVSPEGTRIATGSKDWTTRIWDVKPRTELAQLKGHEGVVTAVAATPDGARIVTASADDTALVWDAKTGGQQKTLSGHTGALTAVAVTPGGRIVTASTDKTARIWDAKTGNPIGEIVHDDAVTAVAVTRDKIITGSGRFRDQLIRVWDAEKPDKSIDIKGHEGVITDLAAMDDGRIISASEDATARIWRPGPEGSYEEERTFRGHQLAVTAVAVLDHERVVTGSADKTVLVWEVRKEGEVKPLRGHQDAISAIAVARKTPDGPPIAIITGSKDGTVRVWDAETYEQLGQIKAHERFVTALALVVTSDGPRIVTGSNDKTAKLWKLLPIGQELIDHAKTSAIRCLSPVQRERYFLPPTQPRWCGEGGKYPYDSVSASIEGRRLMIDGKVAAANLLFAEALGRESATVVNPAWAEALIEYARRLLAERQDEPAKAMFAEALKRDHSVRKRIDAEWASAYFARGRAYLRVVKDDDAKAAFAEAVKYDPSAGPRVDRAWAVAYVDRGRNYLRVGRDIFARRRFAQALQRDPSMASRIDGLWVNFHVERGSKLARDGKYESTDAAFIQAMRQIPGAKARLNAAWTDVYIGRGHDLLSRGRDEDAKIVFARALQHDPSAKARIDTTWAKIYVQRGLRHLRQGDDDAAKDMFAEAIKSDHSVAKDIEKAQASAYVERGGKHLDQGDEEAAKGMFAAAIERDSSLARRTDEIRARAYVKRGVAFIKADKDDDAMDAFAKAWRYNPSASEQLEEKVVDAYIDHGKALIREGKDAEADVVFAKAIGRNPAAKKRVTDQKITAAIKYASSLMGNGNEDEANVTFSRTLERNPAAKQRINVAWGSAYNELAWDNFLKLPKDKPLDGVPEAEAVLRLAQKAITLAPDNVFALDTRGSVYRAMGRIDEALDDLTKAIDLGIKAPSTYMERGRCHESKGNKELAEADYQKAVNMPAEDDYSKAARAFAQERLAEFRGPARPAATASSVRTQ